MALVGQLEDLNLTELFHMLSLFQKSGRLTLSADDRKGVFLFKGGKIIHAANGRPHVTLGQTLVDRDIITEEALSTALDTQSNLVEHRRIGSILIEMGVVTEDEIETLVRERLQSITEEFLHAERGFFSFKPEAEKAAPSDGETHREVDLPTGMNTDQFILDLLTRLDAVQGERSELGAPPAQPAPSAAQQKNAGTDEEDLSSVLDYMVDPTRYGTLTAQPDGNIDITRHLAELRSLMVEVQLRSPAFTGEITLMILRFATQVVNRGLLCHVSPTGIMGIGQFGLARETESNESIDRRIRTMRIPLHEPSVFMEVFETMHSYQGPLKASWWNDQLVRLLGGPHPTEVLVIPIIVDGMIEGMFYGDNVPHDHAIGPVHALELLMIEAGLAMEKRLLRSRLKQVQDQLQALSVGPRNAP